MTTVSVARSLCRFSYDSARSAAPVALVLVGCVWVGRIVAHAIDNISAPLWLSQAGYGLLWLIQRPAVVVLIWPRAMGALAVVLLLFLGCLQVKLYRMAEKIPENDEANKKKLKRVRTHATVATFFTAGVSIVLAIAYFAAVTPEIRGNVPITQPGQTVSGQIDLAAAALERAQIKLAGRPLQEQVDEANADPNNNEFISVVARGGYPTALRIVEDGLNGVDCKSVLEDTNSLFRVVRVNRQKIGTRNHAALCTFHWSNNVILEARPNL